MDILTRSAGDMLAALAKAELTPSELLDLALARIDAVNPALNAVVARDVDGARNAAARSDDRYRSGAARPLEGLPITIKDAYSVKGMVSTGGAPAYRDRVPDEDAVAVARLRDAGAVIVGKANVPLFSGDFQSFNGVYGVTNNPWDIARSPGGSSGGSASAVATGMSAFELGSDIAGSIRWPAHCCGVFGLKPSFGRVPMRGHVPPPPGVDVDIDLGVGGPLARSAADLDLVLAIVAGALDARPLRRDPKGLRVAVWLNEPFAPVDRAVSAAVGQAAALLSNAGAVVSDTARPSFGFEEAFEVYALMLHGIMVAGMPEKVRGRLAAEASTYRPGDMSHRALQARGACLDNATRSSLASRRAALKQAWSTFFGDWDVVLAPPAPVRAIAHDHRSDFHARRLDVDGTPQPYFDFMKWSSLATVAHLPAAVAPVSYADGLPAGVQIIAAEGADRTAIAVAAMLEALGCRYQPPPIASSA